MPASEVTVKVLASDEAGLLDRVDEDVFDNAVRADLARTFLSDSRSLLAVAIDEDVVVGMASALSYVHPDKPPQLFINEVGVSPAHHRRGLGRRLVSALLERGRELGCTEAWVATEEENVAARALYCGLRGKEDSSRAVVYTFSLSPADE